MRIVDLEDPKRDYILDKPCGLCLGQFDGVHLGHRALIDKLIAENKKREISLPLGAFCFRTPPKDFFSPVPVPQLTPLPDKLEKFRRAGLRFAVIYDFPELKDLDPLRFTEKILIETLDCRLLVCGYNHTFGQGAKGTPDDLEHFFGSLPDRDFYIVPEVKVGENSVSSTLIRRQLLDGHPEDAARLLGNAYSITGKVQSGQHLGRTIETPTANLGFGGYLVPRKGVYITTAKVGTRTIPGISNVGSRPTVHSGDSVNCETFLFGFQGNLYQKTLTVFFLRYLRPEMKFQNIRDLQEQIKRDIEIAKRYFDHEQPSFYTYKTS